MKFLRKLAAQPAFKEITTQELKPGCSIQSDQDMIKFIRDSSGTVYHPCGTCRMSQDPENSVVDSMTRVHGVDHLNIIDASIFPNIIAGNTNGPVLMTAHRAAEFLR